MADDREVYPPGGRHSCRDENQDGYWCEREPGHPGAHAALIVNHGDTVTWETTDEDRLAQIEALAAQMTEPPLIITAERAQAITDMENRNAYTLSLPRIYEDTEKVVAEEPEPFARATLTVETEHGVLSRIEFMSYPQKDHDEDPGYNYVGETVGSVLRAARGAGWRE